MTPSRSASGTPYSQIMRLSMGFSSARSGVAVVSSRKLKPSCSRRSRSVASYCGAGVLWASSLNTAKGRSSAPKSAHRFSCPVVDVRWNWWMLASTTCAPSSAAVEARSAPPAW